MFSALAEPQMMSTSELISCILVLYIQPILCILGILFNSACLGVFIMVWNNRQYYRKTALILYLGAMSLCNIAQLLLSFPVIIAPAVEQFIDDVRFPNEAEFVSHFNAKAVKIFYPLLMASNYASIWLLTLICAQRFHSICHPSNAWKRRLCFIRQSKLCIGTSILLAIAINSVRWWELERTSEDDLEPVTESFLRFSTIYIVLQEGLVYGLCVYIIPMAMLIWFNYHTLRIIADSTENQSQFQSRQAAEHRTALMTISVFCAFFACSTMAISLRLVIIAFGNLFQYAQFAWLPDLSNLLMNTNCLVMPVVCFIFTRGFRDLFFALHQPRSHSNAYTYFSNLHQNDPQQRKSLCANANLNITTVDDEKPEENGQEKP